MRKKKILFVKKLENPDFSNLNFKGKNLMMYYQRPKEYPGRVYLGQVIFSEITNCLYLKGFGLIDALGTDSELEKQTILGREYFGRHPFYDSPLTGANHKDYHFYQFKGNINNLRKIVGGKKRKLIIREKNN